jgi:hypothetical protein
MFPAVYTHKYRLYINTVFWLCQDWKWRQYVPMKHWHPPTSSHGIASQKGNTYIFTAARTSNVFHKLTFISQFISRGVHSLLYEQWGLTSTLPLRLCHLHLTSLAIKEVLEWHPGTQKTLAWLQSCLVVDGCEISQLLTPTGLEDGWALWAWWPPCPGRNWTLHSHFTDRRTQ